MSHCDARVQVEVKNFQSQKIFNFFSKRVFSMVQDSGIVLSEKIFSDFQTILSPGNAMRSQRQKLPSTCNQRRRTLPVRITWKGDWTSGVSLRCKSASRGFKIFLVFFFLSSSSAGFPVSSLAQCTGAGHSVLGQDVVGQEVSGAGRRGAEFRGAGRHWGNIPGAERRGAGGQWGRTSWGTTSWGRTSLGQYPWGRTSWGRRSVGQDVVGQNFVGQDVTGAISLGQDVSGAGGSGAGSRESFYTV